MNETSLNSLEGISDARAASRRQHWRFVKDRWLRRVMAFGGISVIVAVLLIFVYLLSVVLPMFRPATLEARAEYAVPGGADAETLYLGTEEYAEIGLRLTARGEVIFFATGDGRVLDTKRLPIPAGVKITAVAAGERSQGAVAVGLSDGRALLFQAQYKITYPGDKRRITPSVHYPLGPSPLSIAEDGQALTLLTVQSREDQTTLAAMTEGDQTIVVKFKTSHSLLGDTTAVEREATVIPAIEGGVTHLALSLKQRDLVLASAEGFLLYYDITNTPHLIDRVNAVANGARITALEYSSGGISVLTGDSRGRITQWFPLRAQDNRYSLARVREFQDQTHPITTIAPEYYRKGFAAADESGSIGLYHATAHRTLLVTDPSGQALSHVAMSPRADALMALDRAQGLRVYTVHNEHPEVSWRSLWGKVWYESRQQPEFIWQSSSAAGDFEPKFSLTPLAYGTLKASFYALLLAIPIAVMGAVYTGYFMSPAMREIVKPTVEIMGALPTVVLGFLAGLWLAPLVEQNLPGIFAALLMAPLSMIAAAWLWTRLPARFRQAIPGGWEAATLMPVIALSIMLSMGLSEPLEAFLFDGNMRGWLDRELGLAFDQRNSLVVGIAMGVAVIPPIFSISEDAIFSVPRHLTLGSLALGATPWQTLARVVLLTASPGIFSAVMIGMGRVVGETMIVLMATGNTPVMDFNLFTGFRALSANIAVEMPESEVNSTHYRVLFLAALVLFTITFISNTIAELVRQRLRSKYSTL
ncbi:MAG: ABC transporter permease subunit [Gammaproteobacteria bacterium]